MWRWPVLFFLLLLHPPLPALADEAADLIRARQCFPAALLLSRAVAASQDDPAALERFCGLLTGSCDGTDRRLSLPPGPMAAGAAWQACLRRIGDMATRLAMLPPGDTCEERAELAIAATLSAKRAKALYRPLDGLDARLEMARSELAARPLVLADDPCPPSATRAPVELPAAKGGSLPEQLVAAVLAAWAKADLTPLAAVAQAADQAGAQEIAAIALARRAEGLADKGPSQAALATADAAVLRAASADLPEAEERALAARARLLDAQGQDLPATIAAYDAALRALDRRRADLLAFDWIRQGSPYRLRVKPMVERYVALQIDLARTLPEEARTPIYQDVLRRADQARAAELSDYFRDDCVASLKARTRSVGMIDPGAAALVTVLQGQTIELFMMLPDGRIRHHRSPLPPPGTLEAYPWRLIDTTRPDGWMVQARELYDLLIRPFDDLLGGVRTLVFVPDGPLRHVLPATLLDGDTLLIERHAVALNPGLGFIDDAPVHARQRDRLLGAVTRACPPRWDALSGTGGEIAAIAALQPSSGTVTLLDEAFARADLFQDLATRPLSVLHFATHAEFAPQASDSKVLLGTCDELDLDDLERLIKQARYRDRPVELLVLSACQSALGDDRAALGLAGLAVKSGARAALGSMWKVDDMAAARLMTLFHAELLQDGVGKAEALRRAQRALAAEPGMAAPVYWAAFQLIGDWR